MSKAELRKKYRNMRKMLGKADIENLSGLIQNQFLDFLQDFPDIKHIHIFLPIIQFHEINTLPLIKDLFDKGIKIYTSAINMDKNVMETLLINPDTQYQMDKWGIPVPVDAHIVEPDKIQMVLVPLLAFDGNGHRLGYGKGYYDKFLSKLKQNVMKVGLSFFPPAEELPSEEHDIALDFGITPEEVFKFR